MRGEADHRTDLLFCGDGHMGPPLRRGEWDDIKAGTRCGRWTRTVEAAHPCGGIG